MKLTVREVETVAPAIDDDALRKRVLAHALRSEADARLRAGVSLAEIDERVIVSVDALDADPALLNVENGILHLDVGELAEHDSRALLTKLAPVEFAYDAEAPRWLSFLDQVFAGDQELIGFVQRAVGYSLTGSTEEQVLFLLHGSGANGKTTFVETLRALLGDYGQQTPAETFLERRGDQIPNDLARLRGARFVAAVETGENRRLAETLVKRLTGGDTISARFLRQEWFEFRPAFKAWLATNHKPEIRGTDDAVWRRIRLIPFNVKIPEADRERDLPETLRGELPGILRWALDGCVEWRARHDLEAPAAVTGATASYRDDMDVLGRFLDDCVVVDPAATVKAGELYNRYGYWVDAVGERERLTQKMFGTRLGERAEGFTPHRNNEGRSWRGLRLRNPELDGEGGDAS